MMKSEIHDVADHLRDAFEYVRVDAGRHYNLLI